MSRPVKLGELQHAILQILWRRGEATVAEVHQELLDSRQLALTTVATMLRKMEQRELCSHRVEGRQFIYRAELPESEVREGAATELRDRVFGGDLPALVSQLLDSGAVAAEDLEALRQLIDEKADQLDAGPAGENQA